MNIRKILNIPSSAQKSIVKSEHDRIDLVILTRHREMRDTIKELNHQHDFSCPKCQNSSEDTIVDKISDVNGGLYSTRTEPVNHCNECGNEWHKGNATSGGIHPLVKNWKKFILEDGMIPVGLEDFSAEAIKIAFHEWGTRVSLRVLRKKFHSVYDKK